MKLVRSIKSAILILIAGGVIGIILLVFAYMIPTDSIIENARASVDIFKIEGSHPQVIHGYQATTLDNYTDAWMLRNAFYNGEESAWQKALYVYYYGYTNEESYDARESMIAWLEGKDGYEKKSYARYWHGYLILLKPLLYFWDYGDIRGFLKWIELSLVISICVLLSKRKLERFIPAFIAAMICIEFQLIGMSMQFSWVFLIGMVFSVIILRKAPHGTEQGGRDELLFLIIGMLTSYFDFLTYPLFTLGIPLLFSIICEREEKRDNAALLGMAVKQSVYWAVGYIGMWVQKWILCTVFTEENLFADGLNSILERSGRSVNGTQVGYIETLRANMAPICKYPYVLAVLTAVVLIFVICRKEGGDTFSGWVFLTYLYIAILPFCWYAVSINHSYIHAFMTYKLLGIPVFAVLCMLTEVRKNEYKIH